MLRTALAASLVAVTAVGVVAPAQAATAPVSTATRQAITYAATHNRFTAGVGAKNITVSQIRISSTGRWASALDTPKNPVTDPAQVLLVKSGTHWVAKDLGTDGVGCGIVSQRTRSQLHLWGSC